MADRNVKVVLSLISAGYESGMAKAKAATDSLATSTKGMDAAEKSAAQASQKAAQEAQALAEKRKQAAADVSTAMLTAGVALLAGVGMVNKSFTDFDRAMSHVEATGVGTGATMDALRDKAIELGASTSFSASEAAQGIEELAKAGLGAGDILSGGLAGALDLAAAGTISVASAAEITAVTLKQFGLEGSQAAHVSDLLAAGANEAVGGVQDIGAALNMAGTVAAQYGVSIEETVGSLAMFASNALVGSDAGTSFKQMLLQLAAPTGAARRMLDEYNISAYDAQGNFVGMESLAGQLKTQLGGLSQEQQNAALKTIFGADAIRTATVLMKEGAEGVREWTAKVNQQGYAADMAKTKLNNLAGDVEGLGGAFESAFIRSGSGVNGFLRGAVQGLTGFVNLVASLPAPVLATGTAIAGLAGAALVGAGGFIKIVQTGAELRESVSTLREAFPRLDAAIGKVGWKKAAISAAVLTTALVAQQAAAQANAASFDRLTVSAEDLSAIVLKTGDVGKSLDGAFTLKTQGVFSGVTTEVDGLGAALQRVLRADPGQQFEDFFNGMLTGGSAAGQMSKQFAELDKSLASLSAGGSASQAAAIFDEVARAAADQGISVGELAALFPSYAAALKQSAGASGAAKTGADLLAGSLGEVSDEGTAALDALVELGEKMLKLSGSQMGYEASLDDATAAIKEHGKAVLDASGGIDISTEKGRALKGALDDVASSSLSVIDGMVKAGEETGKTSAFQQRAAQDFIATATAMGMGQAQAIELARRYELIPDAVVTAVSAPGAKLSDQQARELTSALMAVPALTSAQVLAPGARPSKSDVDAFVSSVGRVPGVTTAQINTLASLYGVDQARQALASLRDKTVYVNVVSLQRSTRMDKPVADGGLFVGAGLEQRFAAGGFMGSFQGQQSQIRPAGGTGVRWAEEGAGPWEAFISGHPAKRWRSRWLLQEVAARLGGQVAWTSYADGGIHTHDSYRPSAVASSLTTQVQAISRADLDYLSDRLAGIVLDGAQRSIQTARRSSAMAGRASA